MKRKATVYDVYHGWAFSEYVTTFKTKKQVIEFIERQEYPEEWCYEERKVLV